ncbi:gas vesicle protein GvpJ [Streptomyces sp. DSM 42041]|uniref:Gas vesicle protein A n=1 Tax=Streptomyces hazeniae TaxID=3075538 RepID=A0ABU2P0B2_9ACTN|nr:gas vesicle protein GvpJ [Streptomyces sp. DSM 42041]MDT0382345.1 gas vesicle protein GvpJ [Streptomyces sp. DSM 42041]
MSTTTTRTDGIVCVPRTGTLYDVLELILDRGMVIDVFVRVSLVGIEILKIDARVVVASVDTYLRFAEACNRLDLESDEHSRTVPELFGGASGRAKAVGAKKAAKAVGSKVKEAVGADEEEEGNRPGRSGTTSRAVGASRTRRSRER